MTTILVVDDEPSIHRFLSPTLAAEGYRVERADTGRKALDAVRANRPDLVVLDLGLPDIDGKAVLKEIRGWSSVPVVVLSARDREAEKVSALDLGADDFVNKPFGVGELLARIRAALRRHHQPADQPVVRCGPLEVDLVRRRVKLEGEDVHLTQREYELLALLARHAGSVVTHKAILTTVWGPAHVDDTQYLRVYIGQLRQKLGDTPEPRLVLTEPGIGYRLADAD